MSAVAPQIKLTVPWEVIWASSAWLGCSKPEQNWLTYVLANHDFLEATRLAYKCKSAQSNKVLSYELRRRESIKRVLAIAAGQTVAVPDEQPKPKRDRAREKLVATVRKHLRAAQPGSIAASKLLSQLEKLTVPSPEPEASVVEESKHFVGELVSQNGQNFRVTAVDDRGGIVDAEEAQ
jgi:hypothetical protein